MSVNIGSFDLRLLVVLEALLIEKNLTRAARRIGMSQPAMSNALKRLRSSLGDQLFVRTVQGLRPTPKAIEISGPVSNALLYLREALEKATAVEEPKDVTLSVAVSEQMMIAIIPKLIAEMRHHAPGGKLQTRIKSNLTVQSELDLAEVDLAIGFIPRLPKRFGHECLFIDKYVCVMRHDHPLAKRPLTRKRFDSAAQVAVRSIWEGGTQIDRYLHKFRGERKVVVNVSQFQSLPKILTDSDVITCIPKSIALSMDRSLFQIADIPYEVPEMPIVSAWNSTRRRHPAVMWLRNTVRGVGLQVSSELGSR